MINDSKDAVKQISQNSAFVSCIEHVHLQHVTWIAFNLNCFLLEHVNAVITFNYQKKCVSIFWNTLYMCQLGGVWYFPLCVTDLSFLWLGSRCSVRWWRSVIFTSVCDRSQFPVTRVSLLSEMVEECLRLDVLFIIDIKCYDIRVRHCMV